MKKKSIVSMIVSIVIMLSSATAIYADNVNQVIGDGNTIVFVDVPSGYWAENEIKYFASQGIVTGTGDNNFDPEDGVTREQFCKMLVLTFNAALSESGKQTFSDVETGRWSYPYIEVCSEFLTGYTNPFGGLPAFHPEEYATREDIAVALVRMMGLTDNDVQNKNYATQNFSDGMSISPSLMSYVSLACERGLINGYPDGTFAPSRGITRAETVVLLNRATKQAVTTINAELDLSANTVYSQDGKTATVFIETDEGAAVTVDGEKISMTTNGNGKYEGTYTYKFEDEGKRTFDIEASKAGKIKTKRITLKYEINAPVLSITSCPSTTSSNSATIMGSVKDPNNNSNTVVTINGTAVYVDYYGNWQKTVNLYDGENEFTIIASNSFGKSTTEERTIEFKASAPVLTITNCPSSADYMTVTVRGVVKDANDNYPSVTVNGYAASVDYYGNWQKTIELKEGENKVIIVATNKMGRTTTEKRSIRLGIDSPTLKITSCPKTSEYKTAKIKGTVKDSNDSYPTVKINGSEVYVDYYGNWEKTVDLKEGENTFTVTATNKLKKSTSEECSIFFGIDGPVLKITNCPTSSEYKSVKIKGTVKDNNDGNPIVTVNGSEVYVDYYGNWEQTVDLSEGENTFKIVAKNNLGKSTSEECTISFGVGVPVLKITNCPETTDSETATIKGTVKDTNDSSPTVTINGSSVYVDYYGSWEKKVDLTEGENVFTIVATNTLGKSATVEKTITFEVGAPEILFTNCPDIAQQENLAIQGKIKGFSDGVKLYVNDQEVSLGYNNDFSKKVVLQKGDNTFVFRAVNSYGKSSSVVKTIKYNGLINPPELKVDNVPSVFEDSRITISGVVNDPVDSKVNIFVNDKKITSGSGSWSASVALNEGSNDIIIVAENSFGKSTTVVKTVVYSPDKEDIEKDKEEDTDDDKGTEDDGQKDTEKESDTEQNGQTKSEDESESKIED